MRKRLISPDYWTDPVVVRLSLAARLFFIGLWQCADDEGRLKFEPDRLRMKIFPAEKRVDILALTQELIDAKELNPLVSVYEVDGVKYLQVTSFTKHQKIDKRRESRIPAPDCADSRQIAPICAPNITKQEQNRTEQNKNVKGAVKAAPQKITCGEFENVHLTAEEISKLEARFGKPGAWERINRLSGYMESHGKTGKYKSHYATILNWSQREAPNQHSPPKKSGLDEFANEGPVIDITPTRTP